VEVAGLKDLQSLLSLSWATIIIPTTVSEGIALKLRRSGTNRDYLYTQVFAGLAYIIASGFMLQLRRVKQKSLTCDRPDTGVVRGQTQEYASQSPPSAKTKP
jgi:hypothetical protein